MVLGVLSYAGQAREGMDESAAQRRRAEEDKMRLAQSRRAESEAQRKAQMEQAVRRDISSAPIPEAPVGLALPMGKEIVVPKPAPAAAPTAAAPTTAAATAAPTAAVPTTAAATAPATKPVTVPKTADAGLTEDVYNQVLKALEQTSLERKPPAAQPQQAGLAVPSAAPTKKTLPPQQEKAVIQAAETMRAQQEQAIANDPAPTEYYAQNYSRLPEDYNAAVAQRQQLVAMAQQYQGRPEYAELYQDYLTKISSVDSSIQNMLQSNAIELFRATGNTELLAGELTRRYGRNVKISRRSDGMYEVFVQGSKKSYAADSGKLVSDAMQVFSSEYRTKQIEMANAMALERFKSALRMDEKAVETTAQFLKEGNLRKLEAMLTGKKAEYRVVQDDRGAKYVAVFEGGRVFLVSPTPSTRPNVVTGKEEPGSYITEISSPAMLQSGTSQLPPGLTLTPATGLTMQEE